MKNRPSEEGRPGEWRPLNRGHSQRNILEMLRHKKITLDQAVHRVVVL